MDFLFILNSVNSLPVALFIDLLDCIVAIINKRLFFPTQALASSVFVQKFNSFVLCPFKISLSSVILSPTFRCHIEI